MVCPWILDFSKRILNIASRSKVYEKYHIRKKQRKKNVNIFLQDIIYRKNNSMLKLYISVKKNLFFNTKRDMRFFIR